MSLSQCHCLFLYVVSYFLFVDVFLVSIIAMQTRVVYDGIFYHVSFLVSMSVYDGIFHHISLLFGFLLTLISCYRLEYRSSLELHSYQKFYDDISYIVSY